MTPRATDPAARRSYNDACGAAHALDLIGERWALLVVRELMLGPKRFSDLRASLPGISANVLTQRLDGLERAGILRRHRLPPPAPAQVYELTQWGYEAEPILQALGRWAVRSPAHDTTLPLSAVSLMLSFRTMIDADHARGEELRLLFRIAAERYAVRVADGGIAITRGEDAESAATVSGSAEAIARLVYGAVPLATLEAEGALAIAGDRAAVVRFAGLFHLPPKALAPPAADGTAERLTG